MKRKKLLSLYALLPFLVGGSALLVLPACDEGPIEEAGEGIDEAVEDAGDAIEDATD